MRTDRTTGWRLVLLAGLSISVVGLLVAGLDYGMAPRGVSTDAVVAQTNKEGSQPLNYRVWRVFPPTKKNRLAIAVVSVAPQHFNRDDMTALAARLNKEFAQETRLRVGLVDDEDTARLFAAGRVNYPTYEKAERGRYYLDRIKCEEYIQFSTQQGKPRETIRLNCSRPRQ